MKKISYYSIFIPLDEKRTLAYNSVSGAYVILKSNIYSELTDEIIDLSNFEKNHPKSFLQLSETGFIIDKNVDEIGAIENLRIARKFSSKYYHVIINPTMDCNLKCWYCYENHVENSEMSEEIINSFIRHLELKSISDPFQNLVLSLFGGEPLLKPKAVERLITKTEEFCNKNNITLQFSITTNGTCITDEFLKLINGYPVEFQITLDGAQDKHDKVRFFKNSQRGSYPIIIKNLHRIQEALLDYLLRRRGYTLHL